MRLASRKMHTAKCRVQVENYRRKRNPARVARNIKLSDQRSQVGSPVFLAIQDHLLRAAQFLVEWSFSVHVEAEGQCVYTLAYDLVESQFALTGERNPDHKILLTGDAVQPG